MVSCLCVSPVLDDMTEEVPCPIWMVGWLVSVRLSGREVTVLEGAVVFASAELLEVGKFPENTGLFEAVVVPDVAELSDGRKSVSAGLTISSPPLLDVGKIPTVVVGCCDDASSV